MEKYKQWLEQQIERCLNDKGLQREHWAFCRAYEKFTALQQTDVSRLLLLFDQMIKEENEALGKAGFYNQYGRETHANNKYYLAIVKSLIERRFSNSR